MKKLRAAYGMLQKNGYGESVDIFDDVNALTEGEDLSDEFKAKAKPSLKVLLILSSQKKLVN